MFDIAEDSPGRSVVDPVGEVEIVWDYNAFGSGASGEFHSVAERGVEHRFLAVVPEFYGFFVFFIGCYFALFSVVFAVFLAEKEGVVLFFGTL